MAKLVPTLSSEGWKRQPASAADALLTYFFTTDRDQSHQYEGISSLPGVLHDYLGRLNELPGAVKNMLETYLMHYYDLAVVDVRTSDQDLLPDQQGSKVTLKIFIHVNDGGQDVSIMKLVQSIDGMFSAYKDMNNTGAR